MARRAIATALWVYFGWYLAALLLAALGAPTALAPLGGVLMGGLALVDRSRLSGSRLTRYEAPALSERAELRRSR